MPRHKDNPHDPEAFSPAPDDSGEEDLWFLPGPDQDAADPALSPLPRADRTWLFATPEWQAAQDRLSGPLAGLAFAFGELDERLRNGPEGWQHRLALMEVAEIGWWTGDRISADRLALWVGLRLGNADADAQALARTGWAVRRLSGGPGPEADGWRAGISAFLGRGVSDRAAVPEAVVDLAEVMDRADSLHPVTRSAMLFHAWRMLGQGATTDIEAAAMAARHAAAMSRTGGRGARFLPLALTGPEPLRASGPTEVKLSAWIAGAERATLAALLHLDRIRDWSTRAAAATADLSGRTPPELLRVFAAWPMVSAPMAEVETGSSRAAVQRNLDRLRDRGLIREITGQGRFRIWTAQI